MPSRSAVPVASSVAANAFHDPVDKRNTPCGSVVGSSVRMLIAPSIVLGPTSDDGEMP